MYTAEDVEQWIILRQVDPRHIAQQLIDEGKAGWEPADWRNPMENLGNLFDRYTLGEACRTLWTWRWRGENLWPN